MARIRRTVSLKPEVDGVLEEKRGKKNLSTFVNEHFEKEFPKQIKEQQILLDKKSKKKIPISKK